MNRRETIKVGFALAGMPVGQFGKRIMSAEFRQPDVEGIVGVVASPGTFGIVGDGATDDTSAIQVAVNAASAARKPLQLAPGDYRIAGTVSVTSDHFHWVQPHGAVLHCHNPSGPALRFAGDTGPMAFLVVDGLRLVREVSAHRHPMVEFGGAAGLSDFAVRNVFLDGQSFLGDGLHLVSLYNGSFASVMENSVGGIGAVLRNDPSLNTGNIVFADWSNNASPILFFVQEYYGRSHNLINSLHFDNCKHALASGGKFFAGTAAASARQGAQLVIVRNGEGGNYASLDWVVVIQQESGFVWADRVSRVDGDKIALTGDLPFDIAAGDPVIVGRWHTILGGSVSSVEFSIPHFERVNGVLGAGGRGVMILSPYIGANVYRGAYLARGSQQWEIIGPRGALPAGGVVLHQANDSNNSRNVVRGGCLVDLENRGSMIRVDGGTCCYWSDRFQGTDVPLGVWHQDSTVPASQSTVHLIGPSGRARPIRMRGSGALVSLVVQASFPCTAGKLTATVFRNGTATDLSATLDTAVATWIAVDATQTIECSAGDAIDARITTSANWAPIVNDVDVTIYVAQ